MDLNDVPRPGRPWRCGNRRCDVIGAAGSDATIPAGWFGVRKYPGDRAVQPVNIGVFHDPVCLLEAVADRHEAGEL